MATWTDEETVTRSVLREARAAARIALSDAEPEATAGVYSMFLGPPARRRSGLTIYGPLLDGRHPVYHGSAVNLAERFRRHRRNLRATEGLSADDLWISWLPTQSVATALLAEALLIRTLRPLWNTPPMAGFGSRYQGRVRGAQRPTSFDTIHPRSWAAPTTQPQRVASHLYISSFVAQPGNVQALWPTLG